MPLFFLDSCDGDDRYIDKEGLDLSREEAGHLEALKVMPDMTREKIPNSDFKMFRSLVRNENGEVVYEATMALAGRWIRRDRPKQGPVLVSPEKHRSMGPGPGLRVRR